MGPLLAGLATPGLGELRAGIVPVLRVVSAIPWYVQHPQGRNSLDPEGPEGSEDPENPEGPEDPAGPEDAEDPEGPEDAEDSEDAEYSEYPEDFEDPGDPEDFEDSEDAEDSEDFEDRDDSGDFEDSEDPENYKDSEDPWIWGSPAPGSADPLPCCSRRAGSVKSQQNCEQDFSSGTQSALPDPLSPWG